jgi:hypothetical protein
MAWCFARPGVPALNLRARFGFDRAPPACALVCWWFTATAEALACRRLRRNSCDFRFGCPAAQSGVAGISGNYRGHCQSNDRLIHDPDLHAVLNFSESVPAA